jgi:hypothetical protein
VAAEPRPDEDFKEVHEMFHDLMRRWQNQKGGVCPPEIVKRHGKMFGWHPYGNEVYPWVSWDELEKARFSGDDDKAGGLKLIDRDAASVSDMLLIKVVRGELVEAAKNKRMPLNGPYLTPPQIERLVELIGKRYNKPAKK